MSYLRKFIKEVCRKSPEAKAPPKISAKVPTSPSVEDEKAKKPGGGKGPDGNTAPSAAQLFKKAETLYKKKQYAEAAEKYRSAYEIAGAGERGSLAFNVAQAYRLAKRFPKAAVWYEKALALGGPEVNEHRAEIEERIAQMRGDMKKHPEKGPDGKELGAAEMLFEEAELAYGEHDYARAIALYKQAYSRSNMPDILFNIAQACRLAGKHGDAKYWYREYLRQVPDSPYRAEVEKHIEELKKKVPDAPKEDATDDAEKKFDEAERLFKASKYSEAADLYVEVFHDPAVASARGEMAFNLGQCMRLTGKKASAVDWYKKALEYLPADHANRKEVEEKIAELTGGKSAKA